MNKTQNDALKRVKGMIAVRLNDAINSLGCVSDRINEGFLRFFVNHSEIVYARTFEAQILKDLAARLEKQDFNEAINTLEHRVLVMTEDLLDRPLTRRSTNPMANIAHSIECEVKQKSLPFYQMLLVLLKNAKGNP